MPRAGTGAQRWHLGGVHQALPAPELRRELPWAVPDARPRADSVKYAGLPASVDWEAHAGKVEMMRGPSSPASMR